RGSPAERGQHRPHRRRQDLCARSAAGGAHPHRRDRRGRAVRKAGDATMNKFTIFSLVTAVIVAGAGFAGKASAAVEPETAFVLNSLSFLLHGFLVMFMAAGFAMLEAGLVRTKNTAMQCTKNI